MPLRNYRLTHYTNRPDDRKSHFYAFIFSARRYCKARYVVVQFICLSVCYTAPLRTYTRGNCMKLSKPSINPDDLNSFRPISNLTFLSKIRCIERIATKKLTVHADQQSIVSMIGHYNFHDVMWCDVWCEDWPFQLVMVKLFTNVHWQLMARNSLLCKDVPLSN